jgi:FlaA1/EpsC-like NDP-sugar epimerase
MLYKFVEKSNIDKYLTSRLVLIADVFMTVFSSLLSITFVSIVARNDYSLQYAGLWVGGSFIYAILVFLLLKTSSSVERHSSLHVEGNLLLAITIKQVLLGLTIVTVHRHLGYSFPHLFALLIVDGLTCMTLLTMEKLLVVVSYDVMRKRIQQRRRTPTVMVYGTSEDAIAFAKLQSIAPQYYIAGLILPGTSTKPYRVGDVRVYEYSDFGSFHKILDQKAVEAIIFVENSDLQKEANSLLNFCNSLKVKVLYNPPVEEVPCDKAPLRQKPREVRIEDLLGRPEIKISAEAIMREFKDKVIMVTGAAGSIGSQLCRLLCTFGVKQLILFDDAETPMHNIRLELEDKYPNISMRPIIGDVRSKKRLDYVMRDLHPQVVFHAAAYKHVPLMEENPTEAVLANVIGTRNVTDKCIEYGVDKMVMISTDKAVNPTNIMGCTKRLAEVYVQSVGLALENGSMKGKTKFVTTRFGNVLGSNGSVIPRFREQIEKGGPVTVTHPDITRFFMTIPEACRLVLEAATMTTGNQIFVFDMGQSVKIADMARKMIELAGFVPDKDIKIAYTGLRPGEKLYEEVLASAENTIPTEHKNIRIAKVRQYDYSEVLKVMEELDDLAKKIDTDNMVKLMKAFIPEFKSRNSEFERFDK